MITEEKEKVCSCFGNRQVEITEFLVSRTKRAIDAAVADGVRVFKFCEMGDFDDLVYDLVSEKINREKRTDIKRILCFPYLDNLTNVNRWFKIKLYEGFEFLRNETSFQHPSRYYRYCAIIEKSDWALFYVDKKHSGMYESYEFGVESNKKVINFAKRY